MTKGPEDLENFQTKPLINNLPADAEQYDAEDGGMVGTTLFAGRCTSCEFCRYGLWLSI